MGVSECCELECFGRSSSFEVEGQNRCQHGTKPRWKPPFKISVCVLPDLRLPSQLDKELE